MEKCNAHRHTKFGGWCLYVAGRVEFKDQYFRPCCCGGDMAICEFKRFGAQDNDKIVKIDETLIAKLRQGQAEYKMREERRG